MGEQSLFKWSVWQNQNLDPFSNLRQLKQFLEEVKWGQPQDDQLLGVGGQPVPEVSDVIPDQRTKIFPLVIDRVKLWLELGNERTEKTNGEPSPQGGHTRPGW